MAHCKLIHGSYGLYYDMENVWGTQYQICDRATQLHPPLAHLRSDAHILHNITKQFENNIIIYDCC